MIALVLLLAGVPLRADWPTHRGNLARTGNIDEKPGPAQPRVLWVYSAKEQFIASPAVDGRSLIVTALGAFNSGAVWSLNADPASAKRERWSKKPPALKLPIVCSPAAAEGKLVFGDGMHQTAGAVMRCVQAETGLPLWQLAVPGELVHMEGTPAIDRGRVYFGSGHGGVSCVDLSKVTLDGKDLSAAEVQAILDKRWKELQAKYAADVKIDPDLAVPPVEDDLPKPAPRVAWTQGKGAWHVDAPLAVVSEKVLVCSAFLDAEKSGKRGLLCLSAADGKTLWEAPLKLNAWSGATVAGETVIVGCSNIRYDLKDIARGRGEVLAFNLADGKDRWKKTLPGAVVASVAVKDNLAVFTCTDGKVRAVDATTGESKWQYDAQAPFFAAPAISGDAVYVADLKGFVHAIGLADGATRWRFHVIADPAVKSSGKFYGSPVVHGGRVFVATCDLEGASGGMQAVVCIGDK